MTRSKSSDDDALATPTIVDAAPGAPVEGSLRVVSMKTPFGEAPRVAAERVEAPRERPAMQLRALSDVRTTPAAVHGRLAPPRDPAQARSRRLRDLAMWGSVAVIVACGVTLLIWFLAG